MGWLIDWSLPFELVPDQVRHFLGWPIVAGGVLLAVLAVRSMHRAGSAVNPYKPATAIVTDGPYRYSRNPIYVADAVIYLGAAILINSLWPILLLPIAFLIMQRGVIDREERYLEQKFGEQYLRYKATVRRWL